MSDLIIIANADDRDLDKYIHPPPDIPIYIASKHATQIIRECKADGVWEWDAIEAELTKEGFVVIEAWIHCSEML